MIQRRSEHQRRARRRPRSGRVIDQRSTKPSSPAQVESWLGAAPADVEHRDDAVPQPGDRVVRRRPGGQPVHDQPAQLDVEERRAVDGGAGPAQPAGSGRRAGRCRGTGSSPRARSGRGSRRRARRSRAPRSAPATAPRPAPGTSAGFTFASGRRNGASRSRTAISRRRRPHQRRRGGGLRGHVDLGQRQAQRLRGAHVEARVAERGERRDLAHHRRRSPPSRAR